MNAVGQEDRPYKFADVTPAELTQFIGACIRQGVDPEKQLGDLMRDYAETHNPKDAA
jgi:hypothetical protein